MNAVCYNELTLIQAVRVVKGVARAGGPQASSSRRLAMAASCSWGSPAGPRAVIRSEM